MKANELRIGNLIQWISTGNIEEVKDIVTYDKRQANVNNVSISDCIGIELNEEWLIKLSFQKIIEYEKELMTVEPDWNDFGKQDFYVYYNGVFVNQYKYVHELQNLYFIITGVELQLTAP